MKKKHLKMILIGIILGTIGISFFFLRRNLAQEKAIDVLAPANFIDSKRDALDLLEELVNHEFHVRDEVWEVSLNLKKIELLQLTLFSGNQYWFAVSASSPAKRLKLVVYDDSGNLVKLDLKNGSILPGAQIAGGFLVSRSGNYYVGLELTDEEGDGPVRASLVYAYR